MHGYRQRSGSVGGEQTSPIKVQFEKTVRSPIYMRKSHIKNEKKLKPIQITKPVFKKLSSSNSSPKIPTRKSPSTTKNNSNLDNKSNRNQRNENDDWFLNMA